jgi:hypothetical protein
MNWRRAEGSSAAPLPGHARPRLPGFVQALELLQAREKMPVMPALSCTWEEILLN